MSTRNHQGHGWATLSRAVLILLCTVSLAYIGCTGNSGDGDTDATIANSDSMQLAPPAEQQATQPQETVPDTIAPVVTHLATMSTSEGDIVLELYGNDAPKTVENFIGLAKKKFYGGIRFHRVAQGFVIQAGDPNSKDTTKRKIWGQSGESIYGGKFEDELDPKSPSGKRGYVRGVLAMANSGPNTNTSQFFIVLSDEGARHLNYAYTIFGFVRKGMDVVDKIEATGIVNGMNVDSPLNPAVIKNVIVEKISE